MPRINQVVLMPDQTATQFAGRFSEQEMIAGYSRTLYEHLEEDRIDVRFFNDLDPIMPNSLVIHCLGGYDKKPLAGKSNFTSIAYGSGDSASFANMVKETLKDWGKCYADFYHKVSNPRQDDLYLAEGSFSIAVSPFRINGPNAESYMKKLDVLGSSIAHTVLQYLIMRDEQPRMMKVDYKT